MTLTTSMTRTVKPLLDPSILDKLPYTFGGLRRALLEVFQNAYRAKATRVQIKVNANGSRLIIHDNGVGCADPQLLLHAGVSHIAQTDVIDPAGWGFFSLFNNEVIRAITVESHDWRMTFDTARGVIETPVETIARQEGFALTLDLARPLSHWRFEIDVARAFYPLEVMVNGETLPAIAPQAEVAMDSPIGKIYFSRTAFLRDPAEISDHRSTSFYYHGIHAIWNHLPIAAPALREALTIAATKHPQAQLAGMIIRCAGYGSLFWEIDPDTGCRPPLPARHDLIAGPNLNAAAQALVATLVEAAIAEGRRVMASYPETIEDTRLPSEKSWVAPFLEAIALELGWTKIEVADYREVYAFEEDGLAIGMDADFGWWTRAGKPILAHDALTLTHARHCQSRREIPPIVISENHQMATPITFKNLRSGEDGVGYAERIQWEDITLPYFLNDPHHPHPKLQEKIAVVFAGPPAQALAACAWKEVQGVAVWFTHYELGDLLDRGWATYDYLRHDRVQRGLKVAAAKLMPDRNLSRKLALLDEMIEHLENITSMPDNGKHMKMPPKIARLMKQFEKDRVQLEKAMAAHIVQLRHALSDSA